MTSKLDQELKEAEERLAELRAAKLREQIEEQRYAREKAAEAKSELERQFREAVARARPRIEEKIEAARQAMREAYAIAEEEDLPVRIRYGEEYEGFKDTRYGSEKYRALVVDDYRDDLIDLMDLGSFDFPEGTGAWQRSRIC